MRIVERRERTRLCLLGAARNARARCRGRGRRRDVKVFAAASLKEAMDEQARQFEAQHRQQGRGRLRRQQCAGQADRSRRAGRRVHLRGSRLDGLSRRAPAARAGHARDAASQHAGADRASIEQRPRSRSAPEFGLAAALGGERLAMANPDSVPGRKVRQERAGSPSACGAASRSRSRERRTCARRSRWSRGARRRSASSTHRCASPTKVSGSSTLSRRLASADRLSRGVVAASQSPAARPLLDYLRSPPRAPVWKKYGFGAGSIDA